MDGLDRVLRVRVVGVAVQRVVSMEVGLGPAGKRNIGGQQVGAAGGGSASARPARGATGGGGGGGRGGAPRARGGRGGAGGRVPWKLYAPTWDRRQDIWYNEPRIIHDVGESSTMRNPIGSDAPPARA